MYPLSDGELTSWLESQADIKPIFGGVFSRDTLPQKYHYKPTAYVVNTAPSSHPTGLHWISMFVGLPICEYFDSLGGQPPPPFVKFLGPRYMYNSIKLQSDIPSCGYYSLYYIACRTRGISFGHIVQDMYNTDDHTIVEAIHQLHPQANRNWS